MNAYLPFLTSPGRSPEQALLYRALAGHRAHERRQRRRLEGHQRGYAVHRWWWAREARGTHSHARSLATVVTTTHPIRSALRVLLIAGVMSVGTFSALFAAGYTRQTPEQTRSEMAAGRMKPVFDAGGRLLGGLPPQGGQSADLQNEAYFFGATPPIMRKAVVHMEDRGFDHSGLTRPCGLPIFEVTGRVLASGGTAGGSTIAMQTAKQLLGNGGNSSTWARWISKPIEMGAACRLHSVLRHELGPDGVMHLYTSLAPMLQGGGTLRGATAAAHTLWREPASQLSPAQQLVLAAAVKRPIMMLKPGDLNVACKSVWPIKGNAAYDATSASEHPARVNQCRTLHRARMAAPAVLQGEALAAAQTELGRYEAEGLFADNPFDLDQPQTLINIERRGRQLLGPLQRELKREAEVATSGAGPLITGMDAVAQQRFIQDIELAQRQVQRSPESERLLCLPLIAQRMAPPRQACGQRIGGDLAAQRFAMKVDLRTGLLHLHDASGAVQLDTPVAMASLAKLPIVLASVAAGEDGDSMWCPRRALGSGGKPLRRVGKPETGFDDDGCRQSGRHMRLEDAVAQSDNLAMHEVARHLGQPALRKALVALGLEPKPADQPQALAYALAFGTWEATPREIIAAWQALLAVAYDLEIEAEAPRLLRAPQANTTPRIKAVQALLPEARQRAALRRLIEAPVQMPTGTLRPLAAEATAGKSGTAVSAALGADGRPMLHSVSALAYRQIEGSITFWWIGSPNPGVPLARREMTSSLLLPVHKALLQARP